MVHLGRNLSSLDGETHPLPHPQMKNLRGQNTRCWSGIPASSPISTCRWMAISLWHPVWAYEKGKAQKEHLDQTQVLSLPRTIRIQGQCQLDIRSTQVQLGICLLTLLSLHSNRWVKWKISMDCPHKWHIQHWWDKSKLNWWHSSFYDNLWHCQEDDPVGQLLTW